MTPTREAMARALYEAYQGRTLTDDEWGIVWHYWSPISPEARQVDAALALVRGEQESSDPEIRELQQRWTRIPGFCSSHGWPFYVDKRDDAAFCAICEWEYEEQRAEAAERERDHWLKISEAQRREWETAARNLGEQANAPQAQLQAAEQRVAELADTINGQRTRNQEAIERTKRAEAQLQALQRAHALAVAAIDAEEELDGPMPDALWAQCQTRDGATEVLRALVRVTKRNLRAALASPPQEPTP